MVQNKDVPHAAWKSIEGVNWSQRRLLFRRKSSGEAGLLAAWVLMKCCIMKYRVVFPGRSSSNFRSGGY